MLNILSFIKTFITSEKNWNENEVDFVSLDGSEIFLFHFFKLSHFQQSIIFYVLEIFCRINKMSHSR